MKSDAYSSDRQSTDIKILMLVDFFVYRQSDTNVLQLKYISISKEFIGNADRKVNRGVNNGKVRNITKD